MRRKSLVMLVLALVLVATVGVGATLAYFTDSENVTNVVTMGNVNIQLVETAEGGEVTEDGLTFENILPGASEDKDPTIIVQDGSADCYVRAKVTVSVQDIEEGKQLPAVYIADLQDKIETDILTNTDWKYNDGYFYYANRLSEDGEAQLFDTVTIPYEWDNNAAGKSFKIFVSAEAIQADHFEDNGLIKEDGKVTGWNLGTQTIDKYDPSTPAGETGNDTDEDSESTNQQ